MVLFETQSLFILRETTQEILGPWEELEFPEMGTISGADPEKKLIVDNLKF